MPRRAPRPNLAVDFTAVSVMGATFSSRFVWAESRPRQRVPLAA